MHFVLKKNYYKYPVIFAFQAKMPPLFTKGEFKYKNPVIAYLTCDATPFYKRGIKNKYSGPVIARSVSDEAISL